MPLHLLLTRLAVAFGRRRAYPATHPQVRGAETQAFEALSAVLQDQSQVTFSIAKDQLLADDAPIKSVGDVARDFAERLRLRGISAVAFDRGVTAESFSEALGWLAIEPSGDSATESTDAPPSPSGVTLTRIAYGRLALLGADAYDDVAEDLWRALASASMLEDWDSEDAGAAGARPSGARPSGARPSGARPSGARSAGAVGHGADGYAAGSAAGDTDGDAADNTTNGAAAAGHTADSAIDDAPPGEIADAIERRLGQADFSRRVGFLLSRVAEHAANADGAQRDLLGQRLQSLLGSLRGSSVGAIIKSIDGVAEQRRLITQVIDALPADATIAWLEAAAGATGETLSHHVLRLLGKLGTHAHRDEGVPGGATALNDAAKQLVESWTLDDPNPVRHRSLLDRIALCDHPQGARTLPDDESSRTVLMALEIDEFGEDAMDQAMELLNDGHVADLVRYADEAPGRTAAAALHELILSPASIRRILLKEPPDLTSARLLLSTLDERAIEPLLDVLGEADNRTIRRLVYDRLREFGTRLAPHLTPRLESGRWYVVRNALALLHDVAASDPANVGGHRITLVAFQSHAHEQVRVESLRLLAADARTRELALRRALDDASPRVLGMAIDLLTSDDGSDTGHRISPDIVRRLIRLIELPELDPDLRARGVRPLGDAAQSATIRDLLLSLVTRRTLVLRRVVLVDVGPVMLAALDVLAAGYFRDGKVEPVLKAAMEHDDATIRDVVHRARRRRGAAA